MARLRGRVVRAAIVAAVVCGVLRRRLARTDRLLLAAAIARVAARKAVTFAAQLPVTALPLAGAACRLIARFPFLAASALARGWDLLVNRAVEPTAGAVARAWQRAEDRELPDRTASAPPLVLLGALGSLLALSLFFMLPLEIEEDAYILFRYVLNVARGHGPTFNAGEPPLEGFSNMLWMLMLAGGYRLGLSPPLFSVVLGVVLTIAHLFAVSAIARRYGRAAWLPVVLLATNICFVYTARSGLETALVSLLTTLVVWSWIEEERGRSRSMARTSALCFLVAATRVDGFLLFVTISAFRLLSCWNRPKLGTLFWWVGPFVLLFGTYTAARFATFGTVVPFTYYGRMIQARGELGDRLQPGLDYVATNLLLNPALLVGIGGLASAWRSRVSARIASVTMAHLFFVTLEGGDPGWLSYARFLMPVAALLGLLGAHAVSLVAAKRPILRCLAAAIVSGFILLGNCFTVPNPALQFLAGKSLREAAWFHPFFRLADRNYWWGANGLAQDWRFLLERRFDGAIYSMDGQTARHMAATLDTSWYLECGSAGKIAYVWPGPFHDTGGLATPLAMPKDRPALAPLRLEESRFLAGALSRIGSLGYRLLCLYVEDSIPRPSANQWVLLSLRHEGTVPLGEALLDPAGLNIAWWKVPKTHLVVFGSRSADEPIFDGPRGRSNPAQAASLDPLVRGWFFPSMQPAKTAERGKSGPYLFRTPAR